MPNSDVAPTKFYGYAVLDPDEPDPAKQLKGLALTRAKGRALGRELGIPRARVRRGKITLFDS